MEFQFCFPIPYLPIHYNRMIALFLPFCEAEINKYKSQAMGMSPIINQWSYHLDSLLCGQVSASHLKMLPTCLLYYAIMLYAGWVCSCYTVVTVKPSLQLHLFGTKAYFTIMMMWAIQHISGVPQLFVRTSARTVTTNFVVLWSNSYAVMAKVSLWHTMMLSFDIHTMCGIIWWVSLPLGSNSGYEIPGLFSPLCFRFMMMSSNENVFRVTGDLCGGIHQWIPLTKASDTELWGFLWSAPEQTVE